MLSNPIILIKGSSLTFSVPGGRGKAKILLKPVEKNGLPSEDGSAGGGSRGECRAARAGSEAPPPCSPEQSRAEKRTFPFRRKKSARAKLGKLQSAFFCEAVPLGGTAAGRSEAVSFVQNRFGLCHIIAPEPYFSVFQRPFRGRLAEPPIDFVAGNQGSSARRRAPRGWPKRGSTSLAIFSICFARQKEFLLFF